jgi:hypothetical protein
VLGGMAAWPLEARAQQGKHMRRIGVLMKLGADDPEAPAWSMSQCRKRLGLAHRTRKRMSNVEGKAGVTRALQPATQGGNP